MEKLKSCRLFLLDMDGTLYLGDQVIDGAYGFIAAIKRSGRRCLYLTNNSSRAGTDYVNRLQRLGFPCGERDVFTSGMATAMYLREHYPGGRVCLVGTAAFRRELESYGVNVSDTEADVVVAGFDTELVYSKLERAVHFLRRGAPFIAANPDWVCPIAGGEVLPDCGSLCALLTAATGAKPFFVGKPNRSMVDIISSMTGIPNGEICCVGDRLYTDIAVAANAGALSALVMSGETTPEMLSASDVKPDYVFDSVAGLGKILE